MLVRGRTGPGPPRPEILGALKGPKKALKTQDLFFCHRKKKSLLNFFWRHLKYILIFFFVILFVMGKTNISNKKYDTVQVGYYGLGSPVKKKALKVIERP